jgi:ABC-type lipoprotein release transport system permease subunit
VVGIDPKLEAQVSTLEDLIRKGSYLSEGDTDAALVGELLARNLRIGLGDELVVLGQGRDGSIAATSVRVKGIFSSGQDEFDRTAIHIPLASFQDVYSMRGAVHEVVALGTSLDDLPRVKKAVSTGIGGIGSDGLVTLDWQELMPGLVQGIQMDLVSGLIFYVILVVVVAFSILNTFLMAIFERTREFGVLLAVGTTPGRLSRLLLLESTAMTLMGIGAGIIAGCLVTWYFQVHGIVISEMMKVYGLPERMFPQLSVLSIIIGAGVVLLITLLTAFYPAVKVRKLRPVEAMTAV